MTNIQCDLICVGGGYAGLSAASRAAQLGLKVMVLEKGEDSLYACNSRYAGGVMHVSYHNPKDSASVLTQAIRQISNAYADPHLTQVIAKQAGRAVDWLHSEGAQYARVGSVGWRQWILAPLRPAVTQMDWQGRGADMALRSLEKNLLQREGRLVRGAMVKELLMKEGACIGVRAEVAGNTQDFYAKAVVLADGGFQGNLEMVGRYISPNAQALKQRGAGTGCGDAVRMAVAIGAGVSAMDAFYGHVLSRDAMTNDRVWPYPQLDELAAAAIVVNEEGVRFTDEGMGGVYIANHIARQNNPLSTVVIFDEAVWQGPGKAAAIAPNPSLIRAGGTLYKAQTVEDLAAKIGLPAEALVRTVDDYNQAIAGAHLHELTPARSTTRRQAMALVNAPYYAAPACAGLTYTMGGICIDENARVVRADKTPISGLYAAGACTGGIEGGPAVGYVGGLIKAVSLGLVAAEHLASVAVA